jgi:hypothetical protein
MNWTGAGFGHGFHPVEDVAGHKRRESLVFIRTTMMKPRAFMAKFLPTVHPHESRDGAKGAKGKMIGKDFASFPPSRDTGVGAPAA